MPWRLEICSNKLSSVHWVGTQSISNRDHLYPPHSNSSVHLTTKTCGALSGHRWSAEWLENTRRLRTFTHDFGTHLPGMALPKTAWVWLNRLRTRVGRFLPCSHKWDMAPSATCECGAEKQTLTMLYFAVQSINLSMERTA